MQNFDTVNFLECVEKMEKEGTAFIDAGSTDVRRKKRTGAIIAAGFVILPSLFILGAILINRKEMPIGILLAAITILSVMAAGIIAAAVGRVKEIEGGELTGYTQMLNEARQIAVKRMVDEAKELEADAIVGISYGSSQLMAGAAEVIAYGTAVKFVNK